MKAQNIYDDPEFLAGYLTLDRQVRGLDGAAEWPVFQQMIPDLDERRVVDLGCGFGWFSRWADQNNAASVLGVDVSTKMLERAAAETTSATVSYRCVDLDVLELDAQSCDVAFSSLDNYLVEGERVTNWFVDGIVKEHRTIATYINSVIEGGLVIDHIVEFGPTAVEVEQHPELADDRHRPWFLLLKAAKR